ncbi:hypothetical protein V1509DRAFT_635195 [Lipomyces kononenkoae]
MDDKICTFAERKKSKEKVYSSRYVELLESRIEILQNGMAELIRRVNKGDDISCLLSKSGHISINRALEELTSEIIELQKEERERFAIVNEHDDSSEHDTEHEHEHDHDHDHDHDNDSVATNDDKMEERSSAEPSVGQQQLPDLKVDTTVAQQSFSASQNWAAVPFLSVGANIDGVYDPEPGAITADFINPATIIRGHNQHEAMSPSSMTSASSLYSSSAASPSPVDLQFMAFDNSANNVKSLSDVYDAFNDVTSNDMEIDPMMAKVDGLSDMWLTNTFMEI